MAVATVMREGFGADDAKHRRRERETEREMGQQSLIYSFVGRGTVILSEYTEFAGNFTVIASQCLQKLPATSNKFSFNADGYTFNYLVDDGYTYCVVAVASAGRQLPMAFLERIKENYAKAKAASASANSLTKEFGSKMKEQMQYCMNNPEEVCELAKMKAQVTEMKRLMMENIELLHERGEKIELLVDKTQELEKIEHLVELLVDKTQELEKIELLVDKTQEICSLAQKYRAEMEAEDKAGSYGSCYWPLIFVAVLSAWGGFLCGKYLRHT